MLLGSICSNYKNVFELFMAGDNTESTRNSAIHRKYKRYSIFVKNVDVSKKFRRQHIFLEFSKLNEVISRISVNFQLFSIIGSDMK